MFIYPSGITRAEAERLDRIAENGGFAGMEAACREFSGGLVSVEAEHGWLTVPVLQVLKRLPTPTPSPDPAASQGSLRMNSGQPDSRFLMRLGSQPERDHWPFSRQQQLASHFLSQQHATPQWQSSAKPSKPLTRLSPGSAARRSYSTQLTGVLRHRRRLRQP